jgi:FtsH-binding integral membrane protein
MTPSNASSSDSTKKKKNRRLIMNWGIKIIYSLFILVAALTAVLNLNANITFGHGLGDIYYLLFLLFLVIIVSIIFFKTARHINRPSAAIFFLLFVLAIIFVVTLKLTIYRGPEYPWNGKFFLT